MNITRLLTIAATFGITVTQWVFCLALFFHTQPAAAVSPEEISEIVVIGHRS